MNSNKATLRDRGMFQGKVTVTVKEAHPFCFGLKTPRPINGPIICNNGERRIISPAKP